MASYLIAADDLAVHAKTLTAAAEDVVTFARRVSYVEVTVHPGGSAPVYVTTGSTAATIAGARTAILFPGNSLRLSAFTNSATSVVRLICAEAVTYSVSEA